MIKLTLKDISTNKEFTKEYSQLNQARTLLIRIYYGNKLDIIEFITDYPEEYAEVSYWYNRIKIKRR